MKPRVYITLWWVYCFPTESNYVTDGIDPSRAQLLNPSSASRETSRSDGTPDGRYTSRSPPATESRRPRDLPVALARFQYRPPVDRCGAATSRVKRRQNRRSKSMTENLNEGSVIRLNSGVMHRKTRPTFSSSSVVWWWNYCRVKSLITCPARNHFRLAAYSHLGDTQFYQGICMFRYWQLYMLGYCTTLKLACCW